MLAEETAIPVYFANYCDELSSIIEEVNRNSDNKKIPVFNQINANGYQIVVGASPTKKDSRIPIIQGELLPVS